MKAPPSIYKRVWLVVASGGWWRAREIAEAISTDDGVLRGIHNRLAKMVDDGYLTRREIPPEKRERCVGARGRPRDSVEYAVTPDCSLPLGIRVSEALKALNGA
jgi:hypothetical protein